MRQRMKLRVRMIDDLFGLHLRVVSKRARIINQKNRHIAGNDQQKCKARSKGLFLRFLPA